MFSKPIKRQDGFTLVEIIVMIAVLTIGILGTLAVANVALRSSENNKQQVVATNLAREGVELVRAIRDSDWAAFAEHTGPGCWDYYPNSQNTAAQPPPSVCSPRFQSLASETNFTAYLNVGNGTPYLVQQGSAATKSTVYQLCQNGQGLYVPSSSACASGDTYYRRVTIQRSKDLGIDVDGGGRKYSIRVRSYVSWPGRGQADIIAEEYLTDWRKF
jgi:type II secretory pathway pseudopilin PulG